MCLVSKSDNKNWPEVGSKYVIIACVCCNPSAVSAPNTVAVVQPPSPIAIAVLVIILLLFVDNNFVFFSTTVDASGVLILYVAISLGYDY